MHALFKGEVECKMTHVRADYFLVRIPEFESDQPAILNSRAAMLFGLPRRQTPAEILAAAAYSPRRSSNANSLCGAVSAKSAKVLAPIQMDFLPDGFRSSNLICPASQLSLCGVISTGGRTPGNQGREPMGRRNASITSTSYIES